MRSNNPRGSATVETALACVVGVALMAGTLFVGRASLVVRRAHALARHGAALAAAGVPAGLVDAELQSYATRLGGPATWTMGRYAGSAAAVFYHLTEAAVAMDVPMPPALGGGTRRVTQSAVVEDEGP